MSLAKQNFGFDAADPVIIGKTARIRFDIPNLVVSGVASAEWALFSLRPEENATQAPIFTKTVVSSGIALTDGPGGLEVLVTIDPGDTSPLAGGDYFHRLDYVATGGEQFEAARGTGRLTPRV